MATRLTLGVEGTSSEGLTRIVVEEDFDTVLDRWWPLSGAGSSLEGRSNTIYHDIAGKRVMVKNPSIILIEEDWVEDGD